MCSSFVKSFPLLIRSFNLPDSLKRPSGEFDSDLRMNNYIRLRKKVSKFEPFRLLLLSLLFFTFQYSYAEIHYVSTTGLSIPPYGNWESAADSIQKAIDVCNPGDTVVVANGTYHEYIYIDKTITLLGSSADSTVIDGSSTPDHVVEFFQNNSVMENFKILGPGKEVPSIYGIAMRYSNNRIRNCRIKDIRRAIVPFNSSPIIENFFISDVNNAILEFMVYDTCRSIYRNNIIISTGGTETPVRLEWASSTFTNNILIEEGDIWTGVRISEPRSCVIKNNLIAGYRTEAILVTTVRSDSAYIINNTIVHNSPDTMFGYSSITTGTGLRTQIKNNIIAHTPRGIQDYRVNDSTKAHYNLFWDVTRLTKGNAALGDSNIIADPMFVNDTRPSSEMSFNLMLQKHSPAIDKGDISILDKDGSRSDIGMFGGPGGEEYTYLDLAPKAPVNLTAIVTSDSIKLKWNRNSEADTAYYNVYRDTVEDFTIDSTKLIASVTIPFFNESVPIDSGHLYYKITAVDINNNESNPSEEIHIQITSTTGTEEPYLITSYNLSQNYPNPFNPTTKIGYRLTERGYVKLLVYDIKGELIKVLTNKEQESGYYEIEFNGKDYSSQILLYRLEIIGQGGIPVFNDMKKAILLK